MNNHYSDIGYKSLKHFNEQLCGDYLDVIRTEDDTIVIVLADGLGSGVKASILSTLTAKIISTMVAQGATLDDCIETIAATLPVCSQRHVAYSTFTIIEIINNTDITLVQYDNPQIIMLRDSELYDYPKQEVVIDGKKIYKTSLKLQYSDTFLIMSDGCPHAGSGNSYNYNWKLQDIADYFKTISYAGYNAKTLATMIIDECEKLYEFKPNDDATACVIKMRTRNPVNIAFGPPTNLDNDSRMMSLFFSKEGKHIICGGTTSKIAARYLNKTIIETPNLQNTSLPPIANLEGVDIVSEGFITINKVLEYAQDALNENLYYQDWNFKHDGASSIARLLFEEATDVNLFVGKAVNPAHQGVNSTINFNTKMSLVNELTSSLIKMGKKVKVSYF